MNEIVSEITMAELASLLDIDTSKVGISDLDDTGIEVMTPSGFKPVSSYVVKERAEGWKLGDLTATKMHRVFDHGSNSFKHVFEMPGAFKSDQIIDVVDLEVPDGECYLANGWINHNTTPGG